MAGLKMMGLEFEVTKISPVTIAGPNHDKYIPATPEQMRAMGFPPVDPNGEPIIFTMSLDGAAEYLEPCPLHSMRLSRLHLNALGLVGPMVSVLFGLQGRIPPRGAVDDMWVIGCPCACHVDMGQGIEANHCPRCQNTPPQ